MLKDYCGFNFYDEVKERAIATNRLVQLYESIKGSFPEDVEGSINMDELGYTCIRAFIYLKIIDNKDYASQTNTRKAIKWLQSQLIKDSHNRGKDFKKIKRFLRENTGDFAWRLKRIRVDNKGEYEELIFIENAHKGKCKIIKKRKMQTVYETNCK